MWIQLLLTFVQVLIVFLVLILHFNFEMVTHIGEACIRRLKRSTSCTANRFFTLPIRMAITFNFFLFFTIFFFNLISMSFRMIIGFPLLMIDSLNIFFPLQIQKHRFYYYIRMIVVVKNSFENVNLWLNEKDNWLRGIIISWWHKTTTKKYKSLGKLLIFWKKIYNTEINKY